MVIWILLSQDHIVPVLSSLRRLRLFLHPRTFDGAWLTPTPGAEAARQLFLKIKLVEELWNVERKQSVQDRFNLVLTSFSKLPGTLDQRRKFAEDFQARLNEVKAHLEGSDKPEQWLDENRKVLEKDEWRAVDASSFCGECRARAQGGGVARRMG